MQGASVAGTVVIGGPSIFGPTLGPILDPYVAPLWGELKRALPQGLDGSGVAGALGLHSTAEFGAAAGLLLWAIMLAMPLPGVDRRDEITGMLYVTYMLFVGVTLVLALPTAGQGHLTLAQVVLLLMMAAAAGTKWSLRRARRVELGGAVAIGADGGAAAAGVSGGAKGADE
jgi:hypothetical protein